MDVLLVFGRWSERLVCGIGAGGSPGRLAILGFRGAYRVLRPLRPALVIIRTVGSRNSLMSNLLRVIDVHRVKH